MPIEKAPLYCGGFLQCLTNCCKAIEAPAIILHNGGGLFNTQLTSTLKVNEPLEPSEGLYLILYLPAELNFIFVGLP